MGGFPTWTLIGMGVSAGLAAIFSALAFLALSPNLLVRFRLAGSDFIQNARRLAGLSLACTLLGGGFFMAGVPIGQQPAVAQQTPAEITAVQPAVQAGESTDLSGVQNAIQPEAADLDTGEPEAEQATEAIESEPAAESSAAESGAFGQPANTEEEDNEESAAEEDEPTGTPAQAAVVQNNTATPTATNTPQPTPTNTPIPTATPTPTITPTAIKVDTVSVSFNGSGAWVYRVPGNNQLELVENGSPVILESGRAMVQGVTWQEIRLLDGRMGWIQLSFLDLGSE